MNKTIKRNENCIIGLPRCDFVFSSTRECFIGYGFDESTLEMTVIKNLLKEKDIHANEAGGTLAPAQNAFCVKICSKIITSQFCVILLNNDSKDGKEVPNPNINMEYGLMLGFNKYVIPFQKESQQLPFNVAGLDTIKYTEKNFEQKAKDAIDQAIGATSQEVFRPVEFDQVIQTFLLSKKALYAAIDDIGNKNIFDLGIPLGFNLLHNFEGLLYIFFGNFSALRTEIILWRVSMLDQILKERLQSFDKRIQVGLVTKEQAGILKNILEKTEVWLLVTSMEEKSKLIDILKKKPISLKNQVFSRDDIITEVSNLVK